MADDQTSFFSKRKAEMLAGKITIVWFILFSINSLCSSIIVGVTGKYWSQIDVQDKFVICVAITMNWTGLVMAFLYQAAKKVRDGENPLIGSTEAATVRTTTETVVTPPTDK